MRLVLLIAAAIAVAGVDIRPCSAQVAATATIKANVRKAKKPKPPRTATVEELQTATLTLGLGSSRAQLLTPAGEPLTLELDGRLAARRVSLVSALEAETPPAPIECRRALPEAAPPQEPNALAPLICEELVIRWTESETWPARVSIGQSVSTDRRHAGQAIPHFTIVAEY